MSDKRQFDPEDPVEAARAIVASNVDVMFRECQRLRSRVAELEAFVRVFDPEGNVVMAMCNAQAAVKALRERGAK